jgi:hypothetical protein
MKVYITSLKDLNKVDPSNVTCDFSEKSFDLTIKNLNSVNYSLSINGLFRNINSKESTFKVNPLFSKSDQLIFPLVKRKFLSSRSNQT